LFYSTWNIFTIERNCKIAFNGIIKRDPENLLEVKALPLRDEGREVAKI
jgi:hypothetical protein